MIESAPAGPDFSRGNNGTGEIIQISESPSPGKNSASREGATGNNAEWEQEFEDSLIYLVSNLEQMMARLVEEDPLRKPAITAPFFAQMVNQAVSFYEGLPRTTLSAMSLHEELGTAARIYPMLRLLEVCGNRLSLDALTNAADDSVAWAVRDDTAIQEIFHGEILILESYFSFFETFFHTRDAKNRWKEVCDVFIAELKRLAAEDQQGNLAPQ
jgi:hypothetical protein